MHVHAIPSPFNRAHYAMFVLVMHYSGIFCCTVQFVLFEGLWAHKRRIRFESYRRRECRVRRFCYGLLLNPRSDCDLLRSSRVTVVIILNRTWVDFLQLPVTIETLINMISFNSRPRRVWNWEKCYLRHFDYFVTFIYRCVALRS